MIVTFHTKAWADVTMFGDVAVRLLKLMGHSGTIPGAIEPADIPKALEQLRAGLATAEATEPEPADSTQEDEEQNPPISLARRAFPLIELLEAATRGNAPVIWDS